MNKPLWRVMAEAVINAPRGRDFCAPGAAAQIRAIADEMVMQFDPWLAEHAEVAEWLRAEADRAERGDQPTIQEHLRSGDE